MNHPLQHHVVRIIACALTLVTAATLNTTLAAEQDSRKILDAFIIDEIDLTNVTLNEALDFLRAKLRNQFKDTDAAPPNLIVIDASGELPNKIISEFKVRNMPASAFISYLCEITSAESTYQDRSVVIRPRN